MLPAGSYFNVDKATSYFIPFQTFLAPIIFSCKLISTKHHLSNLISTSRAHFLLLILILLNAYSDDIGFHSRFPKMYGIRMLTVPSLECKTCAPPRRIKSRSSRAFDRVTSCVLKWYVASTHLTLQSSLHMPPPIPESSPPGSLSQCPQLVLTHPAF